MLDEGRISSVEDLEALTGKYICLCSGPPHTLEARDVFDEYFGEDHPVIVWRVGDITPMDESDLTRRVVCWHYDNPKVCFSLKDFNILPNSYNNHTAWLCPEGDESIYIDGKKSFLAIEIADFERARSMGLCNNE